jgi:hypothetical protein
MDRLINYDSPEAATFRTNIEGWVSSTGRFWGTDEHMARWEGCTHIKCECGGYSEKGYTKCEECREKAVRERYNALPAKKWEGEFVYSHACDRYFFSEDDLLEYLEDEELKMDDLKLVVCEPNYLRPLEIPSDEFPDDQEYEDVISKELRDALDSLNELIKKHKPIMQTPVLSH